MARISPSVTGAWAGTFPPRRRARPSAISPKRRAGRKRIQLASQTGKGHRAGDALRICRGVEDGDGLREGQHQDGHSEDGGPHGPCFRDDPPGGDGLRGVVHRGNSNQHRAKHYRGAGQEARKQPTEVAFVGAFSAGAGRKDADLRRGEQGGYEQ